MTDLETINLLKLQIMELQMTVALFQTMAKKSKQLEPYRDEVTYFECICGRKHNFTVKYYTQQKGAL